MFRTLRYVKIIPMKSFHPIMAELNSAPFKSSSKDFPRREAEHNSPAFGPAGCRLGSFDYTPAVDAASCCYFLCYTYLVL